MHPLEEMLAYQDLRGFIRRLENRGDLRRVSVAVDTHLEMTALSTRVLKADGPALLFEKPKDYQTPVLTNLFGASRRVLDAIGCDSPDELRELGQALAYLKEPELPADRGDVFHRLSVLKKLLDMKPRLIRHPVCQEVVQENTDIDLTLLPVNTCWPEDAGPLITFGLVVTKGPLKQRLNVGIYRQQIIEKNKVIMRWLSLRGGALDYLEWCQQYPDKPFPVAVAIGADPALLVAATTPVPDSLSEFQFAGLLRGARTEVARCALSDLEIPATAEIILEGFIYPGETAEEGPFGDHTGYYNSVARFPVLTVERLTMRSNPIYHHAFMGRSPWDEPSVMAEVLNELFVPILQKHFPEIVDFYLPPEACSYRLAVVSIRKRYPGHARRVMFAIWSYLRQFTYTKVVIITDEDINVRDWQAVIWAMVTRTDPVRDCLLVDNTPIDYLDFASPVAGLGSKLGIDATNKWPGETTRQWGRPIVADAEVEKRVDDLWRQLGC